MLAKRLKEIVVPDTIQDFIMVRIDRLEEAPKLTLQLASVIGRSSSAAGLARGDPGANRGVFAGAQDDRVALQEERLPQIGLCVQACLDARGGVQHFGRAAA